MGATGIDIRTRPCRRHCEARVEPLKWAGDSRAWVRASTTNEVNYMVNVINFRPGGGAMPPQQPLLSAINDLLQANENAARAAGELPARFIAVDACIEDVALHPGCRPYIDAVVEQDRRRLLAAMREVLDATLEYAKAIECRFRTAGDSQLPARDI